MRGRFMMFLRKAHVLDRFESEAEKRAYMSTLASRSHIRRLTTAEMRSLVRAYRLITPIVLRLQTLPEAMEEEEQGG